MRTLVSTMLILAVLSPLASGRTWTDSTGKHTVEAAFVDLKDGKVRLKKEDGKIITIPIERLSDADRVAEPPNPTLCHAGGHVCQ